jgi:hypothetical protein
VNVVLDKGGSLNGWSASDRNHLAKNRLDIQSINGEDGTMTLVH